MKMMRYKEFEKKIEADIILPNDILEIAKLYNNADKDIFVVGGAVRDFIQGKIPHDYDLVTNALPEESKKILKDWNVSDEQGKNFGVLRVFTESEPLGYEIASYRKDISHGRDNKGDDQKVELGKHITIKDDCLRRDITMNAIFYDINKKEIVDLVGGVDDIKNNVIRAVGVPLERFNEDRLRILRTMRFCARTNGKIDKDTSDAIKNDNRLKGISSKDDVSQERIFEEWNKVIEHSINDKSIMQRYVDLLSYYDMWKQMFPGLNITTNINIDYISNQIIFLDLLWKENINSKRKLLNKLKFPTKLVNEMYFLQSYVTETYYIESVYKLAKLKERFHIDDDLIRNFVKHRKLDKKLCEDFLKYCHDGFTIKGEDLMAIGLKDAEIEKEKEKREIDIFMKKYHNKWMNID